MFVMSLALASAIVGRDGPLATTPAQPVVTLTLPPGTSNVMFVSFPDRLANEQLPVMGFVPINVRATRGLAADPARPGDGWVVMWTENGTAYWLTSETRDTGNLLQIANDLR